MSKIALGGVFCVLIWPMLVLAQAANDYNGDAFSDLAFIRIKSTNLSWYYRPKMTPKLRVLGTLGQAGNHLAPGHWLSASASSIGIVSPAPTGEVVWSVQDRSGGSYLHTLGSTKDLIVSGADFDGSGFLDTCAVSARAGAA